MKSLNDEKFVDEDARKAIPAGTTVDDDGVVTFLNKNGERLFVLDLSDFSGSANIYGELILSIEELAITEGATGTFTVKLASAPTASQPVCLAVNDNTKLSVSPSTLTFTPENWDTEQTVTVTALEDDDADDESMIVTLTSKKVTGKQIVVAIADNDYILFSGKEVVGVFDMDAYSLGEDNDDGYARLTDIYNDETVVSSAADRVYPFRNGGNTSSTNYSKAGEKLKANTTGAYTFFYDIATIQAIESSVGLLNMGSLTTNYYGSNGWNTLRASLDKCLYKNTEGAVVPYSCTTESELLKTDLAPTTKNWTKYYTAAVFHADGRISFYMCDSLIHEEPAPEGFVSWEWFEGWGWSEQSFYSTYFTKGLMNYFICINDEITAEEIAEYYEYSVINETAF